MRRGRFAAALALAALVTSPLLLECVPECHVNHVQGDCPVELSSVRPPASGDIYSECVTVRVWMRAEDFCGEPRIEIRTTSEQRLIRPVLKKQKTFCSSTKRAAGEGVAPTPVWELVYKCLHAEAGAVSVAYNTTSLSCGVSYTVPDPIPDFDLSVNHSSKSISVAVEPGDKVRARWCYRKHGKTCMAGDSAPIEIDPSVSPFALLSVGYLLPCLCVQVYYARTDARRHSKCPFQNQNVRDVLGSSNVTLYKSRLRWSSPCSARELNVSASLCWKQRRRPCTPVLNSTLQQVEDEDDLMFDTSALDKHPQMFLMHPACLGLLGSASPCPSQTCSSWESSAHLVFSTQRGCRRVGTSTRDSGERASRDDKPNTHNRRGMYAVAAVVFVVAVSFLGVFIRRLTKSGASGWLCIQEPVLLVCSSEQAAHIAAVCSLASMLQAELGATVHTALWSQGSQTRAGPGVADLGPLPWLYGQWEAVRRARGKVLIVWSPEATATYAKWSEERASVGKRAGPGEGHGGARLKRDRTRAKCVKLCDDRDRTQRQPSAVIAPVFAAALACLEGALQEGKGQGVALVYFQGLCHRRDIPKTFKGFPRYCLPQDFRGLIQELVGTRGRAESGEPGGARCWPRLVSKVLAMWLAQQLTRRLQTLPPPPPPGEKALEAAGEPDPLRQSRGVPDQANLLWGFDKWGH
uniref:SEFIR domain-containing protein n=1 Tax=Gasterosteus aculeatus aculeatus TaxID=481459 RepID=A0AAQ4PTT9_GASAC